jgi:hypothetical protein
MTVKERAARKAKTPARNIRNTKTERAKIKPADPQQILGRAMLVNVCISMWEGRKHDAEVTAEVAEKHKAAHDAGRYHKRLFAGKTKELSAIITAAAGLRGTHYTQTLPWSDAGWRLLPTENYMAYTEDMRKAIRRYNEAADSFEAVYAQRVREAKESLGDLWKADDYPSHEMVRAKYRVDLQFSPLPAGDDFRVSLPQKELERVAKDVEDRLVRSVGLAMKEAWKRLGKAISKLRDKLDDGKYLRDSMLEDLKDVAETLGRLNMTDDADLETLRNKVLTELASFDADALRDNAEVRKDAASKADEILKAMAGVYTPAVSDDEEEE